MANYKEGSEEAEKRKKKIKVYGSQAEYNAAHKKEIEAGTMKASNTVVHARGVDTQNPESVRRAEAEHEAAIDSWRVSQGLEPHSEKFWSKDSVKRRGKDYSGYDSSLIVKYDLDRKQQEAANLAPLMKASAQSVSGAGAEKAQRNPASAPVSLPTVPQKLTPAAVMSNQVRPDDVAYKASMMQQLAAKQATTPKQAAVNATQTPQTAKVYSASPAMQTKSAIGQMIAGTSNKQPAQSTPSTAFLSPALKSRIQTGENIAKQTLALDRDLMNANDYGASLINNFRSAPSAAVTGAAQMVSDLLGGNKTLGGVEDARAVRRKAQEQLQNSLKGKSELEQTLMNGVYSLVENVSIMLFSPVKGAVLPLMGASAASDAYNTYKTVGVPTGEAVTRAATEGVISGFIEGIGGIGAGGAISKLANRTLASSLSKILGRDVSGALASLSTKLIPSVLENAGSEAFEEVAEYPLQVIASYLYNVAFGNTAGDVPSSWQEALAEVKRNASAAAVAGVLFGGANFLQNQAQAPTANPTAPQENAPAPTVGTAPEANATATIDGQASGLPYNAFSTADTSSYTPNDETLSTGVQTATGTDVLNPAARTADHGDRANTTPTGKRIYIGMGNTPVDVITKTYVGSDYRVHTDYYTPDGKPLELVATRDSAAYFPASNYEQHRNSSQPVILKGTVVSPEVLEQGYSGHDFAIANSGSQTNAGSIPLNVAGDSATKGLIPAISTQNTMATEQNPTAAKIDEAFANGLPEGEPSFGSATVGAAERNPKSYYALMNEYGTLPEGENPARMVDVPAKTSPDEKVMRFARTMMEAKITPEEYLGEFEKLVEDGVFSYRTKTDKEAAINAAKLAAQEPFGNSVAAWNRAFESNQALNKDTLALGQLVYAIAVQNGDAQLAMKTAAQLAVSLHENAQALQSARMFKKMAENSSDEFMRGVQTYYYVYAAQKLSRRFGTEIVTKQELVDNLLNAKTEEEAGAARDAMTKDLASQIPSNFMAKWTAWRYISMLGNLKTFERNTIGNVVMAPVRGMKEVVKAGIERLPGMEKRGVTKQTTLATPTKAQYDFARNDFENLKEEIVSGGKYDDELDSIVQQRTIFQFAPMEALRRGINWMMNNKYFGDVAFAKAAFVSAESRYFRAQNIDPNTATAAQVNKAREYAINEAQRATYRDYSKVAAAIQRFAKTNTATELLVQGVLPFKKTPINILATSVRYSPIGLMNSITADAYKVKHGTMTADAMVDDLASGLTGTGIFALGYLLANMGLITGGKKENDKENDFYKLTGGQNYALKIGSGTYTIDWLTPVSIPIFSGAELFNALKGEVSLENAGNLADAFISTLNTTADPMIGLSMLSSLNKLLTRAAYGEGITSLFGDAISSYVLQAFPTVGGQLARTVSPYAQNAYFIDKTDKTPDTGQTLLNQILVKTPFAQQAINALGGDYQIPAYINEWGEKENPPLGERILENFFSPGYWQKSDNNVVNQGIEALYDKTGELGVLPSTLQKYYTVDGENIYFSTEEYEKAQEIAGKTSKQMLEKLFSSPAYKSLTDDQKTDWVSDIYDYAKKTAKKQVVGVDYDSTRIERYKETGLGTNGQVQLYRILESESENAERDAKIAETFGVDAYTARDYRRKATGDYYYTLEDRNGDDEKAAAKVELLAKYGFTEEDVLACYNAHAGSGQKKADYIADATYALRNQGYSEEDAADMAFYFYAVANQLKGFKVG